MKTIDTYSSDAHLRVILQGPPGSGKTTLACQFPGAYVADCDINLAGPLRWLKANGRPLPIGYDVIDRDGDREVDPGFRFERLVNCVSSALADPQVKTIVIDSATKVSDYIMSHVLRQQGKKQMEMQSWGFYLNYWKDFVLKISAQRKHFVLIAHERVEKDEVDQSLRYFLNIPGQFAYIAGSLFTDVWRCEVVSSGFGAQAKYTWQIRTMPDWKFQLKNSLGLPPVFEFSWAEIERRLTA